MRINASHFIDTAVLLESLDKKGKRQRECEKYLARSGGVYKGIITNVVLGEFTKKALEKDYADYLDLVDWLWTFIISKSLKIVIPNFKAFKKFSDLNRLDLDQRIGTMDRVHLACAEIQKVDNFVTIERSITRNKILDSKLSVKLKEPKDFLHY